LPTSQYSALCAHFLQRALRAFPSARSARISFSALCAWKAHPGWGASLGEPPFSDSPPCGGSSSSWPGICNSPAPLSNSSRMRAWIFLRNSELIG